MKTKLGWTMISVYCLALLAGAASAQSAPQLVNYQGRIANSFGRPPLDGATVDLTFKFYSADSGGTLYLAVLQEDVAVTNGLYNVLVGSGNVTAGAEKTLAAVFQKHADVWMGVQVDNDAEMTPRARIASVPYALSVNLDQVDQYLNDPDFDGDGYNKMVYGGNDCNDHNAAVNPVGAEACGDGIDNDCDGLADGDDPDCWAPPPGMASIPAGCFNMGDAFNEGDSDELPVHNVCLTSGFFIDRRPVTNAGYQACVTAGGCAAPANSGSSTRGSYYGNPAYDDFPVIYVNWSQATAFCAWAGKRLPTEAEWEYAARGGLSGKRYPWGDGISGADANYLDSGDPWDNDTSPVGYYAANGYGLYDAAGNVWEWVNDWYSSTYYGASPVNDPPGPATGTLRVFRGGSWDYGAINLRAASRHGNTPTTQSNTIGFRCAGD